MSGFHLNRHHDGLEGVVFVGGVLDAGLFEADGVVREGGE